ncbi:hypothetical protein [Patulibacter sp.]|uniref:hypothetical protein n=1 Tax=Patulibacter sp. TaxID=1912859 RepID=UPI002715F235|nr:hypothetical protein [Patulibacter sp.]MDO9407956.1 hypothetical protein [Patulibacter sp.]
MRRVLTVVGLMALGGVGCGASEGDDPPSNAATPAAATRVTWPSGPGSRALPREGDGLVFCLRRRARVGVELDAGALPRSRRYTRINAGVSPGDVEEQTLSGYEPELHAAPGRRGTGSAVLPAGKHLVFVWLSSPSNLVVRGTGGERYRLVVRGAGLTRCAL